MMNNEIKMVALNDDELEQVNGGWESVGDGGTIWKLIKRSVRPIEDWLREHNLV